MKFRIAIAVMSLFLPWQLRRLILVRFLGYSIHKSASIGFSLIVPKRLEMGPGARIGHLNMCKTGIELLQLGECAILGSLNWICAVPLDSVAHFQHQADRRPELIVQEHAAITTRHYIDCSDRISIGRFSTFAGLRSVVLTHSIDLKTCKQSVAPVSVGDYCFVGTSVVILAGGGLPNYSILGANSLLNKAFDEPYCLYGGNPARPIKPLTPDLMYFSRTAGFVA